MDAELHYCRRCGGSLVRPDDPCSSCKVIDQTTAAWSAERREKFLAEQRASNARARAEVEAEIASLTPDQFLAGEQARADLEPDIPPPAAVATGKSLTEMNEAEAEEVRRWSEKRRYALPRGVTPLLTTRIVHGCTELTTEDGKPLPDLALAFDENAWWWGGDDHLEPRWLNAFPWTSLTSLEIEGTETIEQRVTPGRAFLFGLFAFAVKKKERLSYLILNVTTGTRIFQVAGMTPMELRGHLAPVIDWHHQHRERLQALAAL